MGDLNCYVTSPTDTSNNIAERFCQVSDVLTLWGRCEVKVLQKCVELKGFSLSSGLKEFGRLAHDGLLLEGKVEEYEKAFSGVDVEDKGVISKDWGV